MDLINQNFVFKKVNMNINLNSNIIFDQEREHEIYFSSHNKIINYDFKTGSILDKMMVGQGKIIKMIKIKNIFYCLLSSNQFHSLDISTHQITKSFLQYTNNTENTKIINFIYSKLLNVIIMLTNTNKILYLNTNTFTIDREIEIKEEEIKNTNKNTSLFLEINKEGKMAIFSLKNKLFILNLINTEYISIDFTKTITRGIFLDEDNIVIGDYAGKMHFISNPNKKVYMFINH